MNRVSQSLLTSVCVARVVFAAGLVLAAPAGARAQSRVEGAAMVRPPLNLAPSGVEAEVLAGLPPYEPEQKVSGVIRLWGHGSFKRPFMRRLVALWAEDFRRWHPDCAIEQDLYGTSSAIPALFTGVGDMAILGEEILGEAVDTFTRATGYPPFGVEIATGSVDVRNFDYAQMFFVHRDNPLAHLTLAQLDAVFGAEHRRGAPKNFRTWGDLGLTGEWAGQPVHLYGWRIDDSFGIYLEAALLEGSHRWNNALHEFAHIYRPDGTIYDHGQQIIDALATDRLGLAVSNVRYATPQVKALALAARDGGPFVEVTTRTLVEQTYPLTRLIPAYINRVPGQPVEPRLREFLRYLLSREGQTMIVRDAGYLPLTPSAAAGERRKLP
jgi:phosphate transport system substrate-binding protein